MQVTWQLSLITLLKTKIDQRSNIFKNKKIKKILKDSEKKYKLRQLENYYNKKGTRDSKELKSQRFICMSAIKTKKVEKSLVPHIDY